MKKYIAIFTLLLIPAFSFAVEAGASVNIKTQENIAKNAIIGDDAPDIDLCVDLKNNLYLRSTDSKTNDEVSLLQDFLSEKYFKGEPTGYFGQVTLKAVRHFQRDNNIKDSGYVGPVTRAKIKDISCGAGSVKSPRIESVEPKTVKVGQAIVLGGAGLNHGGDYVLFDGYKIPTDGSKALNRIGFVIPESLSKVDDRIVCIKAPCEARENGYYKKVTPGKYTVQVVNNNGRSNVVKIEVVGDTTNPSGKISISHINPSAAKQQEFAVIHGYGLERPETKVLFDGVVIGSYPGYLKQVGASANSAIQFQVPNVSADHQGSHEVTVVNDLGRASAKFTVIKDNTPQGKPEIKSLTPNKGAVGQMVTINGYRMNAGDEEVYFGESLIKDKYLVTKDGITTLTFKVPESITPCGYVPPYCRIATRNVTPGTYGVVVKNKNGLSNNVLFEVIAQDAKAPILNDLSPRVGPVETKVTVYGYNLNSGTEYVLFNGYKIAAEQNKALNQLTFIVPKYYPWDCPEGNMCATVVKEVVPGTYPVQIGNSFGVSGKLDFTVK